jgi:hypothetical protein
VSGIRLYIDQRASAAKPAIHVPGNGSADGYIGSRDTAAAGMSSDIVAARSSGISPGVDAAGNFQGPDAAGIGTSVGCAASLPMRLSTSPRVNQLSPALRIP